MKPRIFLLGDEHTTHTTKAAERKRRAAARGMVPLDELNDNEERVLFALESNGPSKIGDVAAVAWADWHVPASLRAISAAKFNSWTRNSLRRLVASGWVVQLGPGLYGPHESLEPRLGGLAVADAEDAHDAAERALRDQETHVANLAAQLAGAKTAAAHMRERVRATWKALLAARKAVR